MNGIDALLHLARTYAEAEAIELRTVSWRVFGDSKKLDALVEGKDIQLRRYEQALIWFHENWPTQATWPETIARPANEAVA